MDPLIQALIAQMLSKQNDTGGLEQELGAYDLMGPEGFRQHSNMGTLDQRAALAAKESQGQQQMVADQLAQMQEFSKPQGKNYGSVAGNIMGGLGDIVRQVGGAYGQSKLRGQMGDMQKQGMAAQTGFLDKMDAGRLEAGKAQMEAQRKFLERLQALEAQRRPMQTTPGATPNFGLQGLTMDPSLMGY